MKSACNCARPNCGCARPNSWWPWSDEPAPPRPPDVRDLTQQLVQQLVQQSDLRAASLPSGDFVIQPAAKPSLVEQAIPYVFAFGVGGAIAVLASNFVRR